MPRVKVVHERVCIRCDRQFECTDSRRTMCDRCRLNDRHRHGARQAKTNHMFVCVDTEWRTVDTPDGPRAVLMTLSFGREDGTGETCIDEGNDTKLHWLIRRLGGRYTDATGVVWKQHPVAFHFMGDSAILARDFDHDQMYLVRKAQASLKTVLCGASHTNGEECPKTPADPGALLGDLMLEAGELDAWAEAGASGILHRYDPDDVRSVITEGGESDLAAYDPVSHLALACSPRRRFYVEHRPHGDRYEGWRRVDIHDIGTAIPGSLESAIDDWNPSLSERERELIAWGKQFRKGWPNNVSIEQVAAYSEAECVATARIARMLLQMIKTTAHVSMRENQLYGSGSVAGAVMKHYDIPTREESEKCDRVVDGLTIDQLAKMTYFGGLIESPVVGLVKGVTDEVDLTSAYPHKLVTAPCMRDGHGSWVVRRGDCEVPDDVKVGHVQASWVLRDRSGSTGPFTVRARSCAVFQPLGGARVWVSLAEFRAARRRFGFEILCHRFVYWEQTCDCGHPFAFVQEMFDKRASIKLEMKAVEAGSPDWWHLNCQQTTLKLILNSMYGKCAQQRPVLGKYANLHLASYVTGATRAQVREESWAREDQGGSVVYQHTDSVLSHGGAPADGGSALGAWKLEKASTDLLILQPGLATALGGGKTATRGCGKDAFVAAAEAYAGTADFTLHPSQWPKLRIEQKVMLTRRLAHATNRPEQAGAFVDEVTIISPVSPKRAVDRAERVPGIQTAWRVPLLEFVWPEDVATLADIKVYRTELERRSRAGEFDKDLH